MGVLLMLLGMVLLLVNAVCCIIILIDAFKNEIWKGILWLIIPFYALYYMFAEFEHEKKGLIILGVFGGAFGGYALILAGAALTH